MGKRIIQQARGHGSLTYRVRKRAYRFRVSYPTLSTEGKAKVIKLVDSPCHTSPLAKIQINNIVFYNPASKGLVEGQEINIGKALKNGDIGKLKDIPTGQQVFNIESCPGNGGKFVRTSGLAAVITKKIGTNIGILLPSKREIFLNNNCRATLGITAGAGRKEKPFIKAGAKFYAMKTKNKLWPRTSAVKMNVIDHPFGSGRGKRIKSKIAKRNIPSGAKVGLLRPRRIGRKKR